MSTEPQVQISRSAPYFCVADVASASAYYENALGFKCEYLGGDPPQFAIQSRAGFAVMLRAVADASKIRPNQEQGGTWDAFFWVNDVESLFQEYRAQGVEIVYEPVVQQAYGMREFAVKDLDGFVLGFGQAWPG